MFVMLVEDFDNDIDGDGICGDVDNCGMIDPIQDKLN